MARVAVQLTNFTGGELSPRLDGRNDLTKYSSGCTKLENFIIYPHGAAARTAIISKDMPGFAKCFSH